MIAGFSFYHWPGTEPAAQQMTEALSVRLAAAGIRDVEFLPIDQDQQQIWHRDDLLFAQTCGYPFVAELKATSRLLLMPCYNAEGCQGPNYSSAIIVRASDGATSLADLVGRSAVINGWHSQSGCISLFASVAALGPRERFFSNVAVSGAHAKSIIAVAEGRSDVAAIDAVCWAQARRHWPDVTDHLKVIAFTEPTPGLPYFVPATQCPKLSDEVCGILDDVLNDPGLKDARAQLLIAGTTEPREHAFDVIVEMADQARPLIEAARQLN